MTKKILAVASNGGHWIQLQRLRKAIETENVRFVSTDEAVGANIEGQLYTVADANQHSRFLTLKLITQLFWIIAKWRPDVVITTGAAPGLIAIAIGKFFSARTIWIDSIANSEELSKSGAMARRWADAWLTQWPHLEKKDGPYYWGSIL